MTDVCTPKGEFRKDWMDVSVDDLIPFCSCICFITSFFHEWPECFGCAGKRVCLMFYDEFLACKVPHEGDENWFFCLKGYSYWAPVKVLCMVRILRFTTLSVNNMVILYSISCYVESLAHLLRGEPLRIPFRRRCPYDCHVLLLYGKRNNFYYPMTLLLWHQLIYECTFLCRYTSRKRLDLTLATRLWRR